MRKDDAAALAERLVAVAARQAEKAGRVIEAPARLLVHDEVGDVARWALRLSPQGWPHRADDPGLRFEAWFYAGKPRPDEEVALVLVGKDLPGLAACCDELVTGGKFARRYKPLDAGFKRFYPDALGVFRTAPVAWPKLEPAWAKVLEDMLAPVSAMLDRWDPDGARRADLAEAPAADPLEALRKKFGG